MRCPGGGGGEEREGVRGPRRGGEHDVGRGAAPGAVPGGAGPQDGGSTVRRQVAQWRRSQTRAMLWRSVWGWVLGGVGTCGGEGGGAGR